MTGNFLTFKDFGQNVRSNSASSTGSSSRTGNSQQIDQSRIAKNIFEEVSGKELSEESQKKVDDIFADGVIDESEMKLLNEVLDEVMEGLNPNDFEGDANYDFVSALRIATEDGVINDREMRRINATASEIQDGAEVAVTKEQLDEMGVADGIISSNLSTGSATTAAAGSLTSIDVQAIEQRYGSAALSALSGMSASELQSEIESAQRDYVAIGVEIQNLAVQESSAQAAKTAAQSRVSQLNSDIKEADNELNKIAPQIESLENIVGQNQEKIQDFIEENIDPINKAISDKDQEVKDAHTNVETATATRDAAQTRLTNADTALASARAEQSRLASIQPDEIDDYDEEGNKIGSHPNPDKHPALENWEANELANAEAEKAAAEQALKDAEADLKTKQEEETKLTEELRVLKEVTLPNAEKELEEFKEQLSPYEQQLADLYQQRSEYEAQKSSAESSLPSAQSAVTAAENQLSAIKDAKKDLPRLRQSVVAKYRQTAQLKLNHLNYSQGSSRTGSTRTNSANSD